MMGSMAPEAFVVQAPALPTRPQSGPVSGIRTLGWRSASIRPSGVLSPRYDPARPHWSPGMSVRPSVCFAGAVHWRDRAGPDPVVALSARDRALRCRLLRRSVHRDAAPDASSSLAARHLHGCLDRRSGGEMAGNCTRPPKRASRKPPWASSLPFPGQVVPRRSHWPGLLLGRALSDTTVEWVVLGLSALMAGATGHAWVIEASRARSGGS